MIFYANCDYITGKATVRHNSCEECYRYQKCYRYQICKQTFISSENSLIFPQTFSINGRNITMYNMEDLLNWMVNTDKLLNEYRDKYNSLCPSNSNKI